MQVDTFNVPEAVWWLNRSNVDNANFSRFMRALGADSFEALNARASPEQRHQNPVCIGGCRIGRGLSSDQRGFDGRLAAHAQYENDAPRDPVRLAG